MKKIPDNNTEINNTNHINVFHKQNLDFIEFWFSDKKQILPMGMMLTLDNKVIAVALDFSTNEIKQHSIDSFHLGVIVLKAIAYGIISEVWYYHSDKEMFKNSNYILPSEHPDKAEAVLYHFETKNSYKLTMWDIKRENNIQPFLVQITDDKTNELTDISSRFSGFIK